MSCDPKIEVRSPREGEWIRIRPGRQVVPLMYCDGRLYLVADNMAEKLREQNIEPPCEKNGVRYYYAIVFLACGRVDPRNDEDDNFFLWPIEFGEDDSFAGLATKNWIRYTDMRARH